LESTVGKKYEIKAKITYWSIDLESPVGKKYEIKAKITY